MNRLAAPILAILAFVALVVLQFGVPWGQVRQEMGGGFGERTLTTWQDEQSGGFEGFTAGERKGWYEGDWADGDQSAVDKIRIAIPLLIGGTVLLLVGAILAFTGRGSSAAIVNILGTALAIVGSVLFCIAAEDLLDGQQDWLVGFYFAIAGCVLGLAAAIVGFASGSPMGRA